LEFDSVQEHGAFMLSGQRPDGNTVGSLYRAGEPLTNQAAMLAQVEGQFAVPHSYPVR